MNYNVGQKRARCKLGRLPGTLGRRDKERRDIKQVIKGRGSLLSMCGAYLFIQTLIKRQLTHFPSHPSSQEFHPGARE